MKTNIKIKLYLDVCAYKIVNKQMKDYLDKNLFENYVLEMLYYDRIDLSKGNDVAKGNSSKKCIICHYWFFNYGSNFQDSVCNGCHNLTKFSFNLSDITIKNVDYHCIIYKISKSEAIYLLKNVILEDGGYI